ncbi:hypothetical protein ALON55S_06556 [Alishewanella longhuensis]
MEVGEVSKFLAQTIPFDQLSTGSCRNGTACSVY